MVFEHCVVFSEITKNGTQKNDAVCYADWRSSAACPFLFERTETERKLLRFSSKPADLSTAQAAKIVAKAQTKQMAAVHPRLKRKQQHM